MHRTVPITSNAHHSGSIMSSDHVDQIRNQFTRQARAYADTAQAKDDDAHSKLVALLAPGPDARVLDVREEDGEVRFTHQRLVLVGRR
jgi:hypothetical protein